MDVLLEVRVWSVGYDELEELAEAIAELCKERGLALKTNDSGNLIKSVISVKPLGEEMDAGSKEKAHRVLRSAARGAQLMIVPSQEVDLVTRPVPGL